MIEKAYQILDARKHCDVILFKVITNLLHKSNNLIKINTPKEHFLLKYLKVQLAIYLKLISLDYQNNYVERLNINDINAVKSFNIPATSLSVLHNYFDLKLCLDLYLAKFLETSAKPFYPCLDLEVHL